MLCDNGQKVYDNGRLLCRVGAFGFGLSAMSVFPEAGMTPVGRGRHFQIYHVSTLPHFHTFKFPHLYYSVRNDFTGLATAALID